MRPHWILAALCACTLSATARAEGQTLAELARQETARRQTVSGGKVITNSDLKPAPPASPAATQPSAPGTTLTPPPSLEKATATTPDGPKGTAAAEPGSQAAKPTDEKKDETYWRKRVASTRDGLSRAQTFQDALQARISALSLDFANRDDPAQRAQVETDRLKAIAELDRVKKEIVQHQTELTNIADEARRAGVPAGWVR